MSVYSDKSGQSIENVSPSENMWKSSGCSNPLKDSKTTVIYRNDGTVHDGPRDDFGSWEEHRFSQNTVVLGDGVIQLGDWRMGQYKSNDS